MPNPLLTTVAPDAVVWRLSVPEGRVDRVRLWSDYDLGDTSFRRVPGGWELRRARAALPPVDRLEYLFEVTRGGTTTSLLDEGNPLRVGGAFGDHSWLALDYRPPAWLAVDPIPGSRRPLTVAATPVGNVDVEVWSPAGTPPEEELPLLLTHDGPEMDALGGLTRYAGAMIALRQAHGTPGPQGSAGVARDQAGPVGLPPMRVALVAPGPRDEWYSANPAYADALCEIVVPAVRSVAPSAGRPVLIGQSLGGLAALHAEWTHPGTFAGLMLQSGSFFTSELDGQESGFAHWDRVTGFVASVLTAAAAPSTPPVTVAYGSAEENAANNRQIAARLASLGCPVHVGEVRDGHTFTCWRDLLDPHLTELLRRCS